MTTGNVFQDVVENNLDIAESLFVEPAISIDNASQTYTPGIHIEVYDMNAPLFISIYELRQMADEAELIAKEQVGG